MKEPESWDMDFDVVVAGYGYAGAITAITANDAGAHTVILEKMAHFGGNSILSGGAMAVAYDEKKALEYMRRTCLDATDDDVIEVFARGLVELPETLKCMAAEVGFEVTEVRRGGSYPFAGSDAIGTIHVSRNEKYKGFSWAKGTKAGGTLFWVVAEHVKRRPIDVRYETPVRELVTDSDGRVLGVLAEHSGKTMTIRARKAVVVCTGGFEHNPRLRSHYLQNRSRHSAQDPFLLEHLL